MKFLLLIILSYFNMLTLELLLLNQKILKRSSVPRKSRRRSQARVSATEYVKSLDVITEENDDAKNPSRRASQLSTAFPSFDG